MMDYKSGPDLDGTVWPSRGTSVMSQGGASGLFVRLNRSTCNEIGMRCVFCTFLFSTSA